MQVFFFFGASQWRSVSDGNCVTTTFFFNVNLFHLDACVLHRWRANRAVPARFSRETASRDRSRLPALALFSILVAVDDD